MRRLVHVLLAVLLVTFIGGVPSGCGRNEGKPNPDLKVPDVPPAGGWNLGQGPGYFHSRMPSR